MASQNPHSRPNLLPYLLNSIPHGFYDHLPRRYHHHHHHISKKKEESFTLLQHVSLGKRGRQRRPFWFWPYRRQNLVSLSVLYVLLSLFLPLQIDAESVHGPKSYSSPLSTLTVIPFRNMISEEGAEEGAEGSVGALTKTGPAVTDVGGDILPPGKDLPQIQEMNKDQDHEREAKLLALLESSPPARKGGGKGKKGDEGTSLYDLIESSDIIANGMDDNLSTLALLLGETDDDFPTSAESMGSSSSTSFSMSPSSSSDSFTKQIVLRSDLDMSTGSSDISSSPTGQPPQLSPQNMENNDHSGGLQFPPDLQLESFDWFRNINPLGTSSSSSPLDFLMVEPSSVLPQVATSRPTEVENSTVTKVEGKPIKVANRRKNKNTPNLVTETLLNSLTESANSSEPVVAVRQRAKSTKAKTVKPRKSRVSQTNEADSTGSNSQQSSNLQIHDTEAPSSSASQSTPTVSEVLPLNTFESILENFETHASTVGILENKIFKLPPFHEVKKRRLPRSVFKEHQSTTGSTTFIIEGDETPVPSVSGILDSKPVKGSKRRRVELEKEQGVASTQLQGQQQDLTASKQETTNSLVATQTAFPETFLQRQLENGISTQRPMVSFSGLTELSEVTATANNSTITSASFAGQHSSELPSAAKELDATNLQLMPSVADQIQSQIQDNSQIFFKVPSPIGRQRVRLGLAAVNSGRLIKRQAPMLHLQQPQQMLSQGMHGRQWSQQTTSTVVHEHTVYSNHNELSPRFAPPNVNALSISQYPPSLDFGQKLGQSQFAQPYGAGSSLQPTYDNFPNLPSANQFQSLNFQQQQRQPYYQNALKSQLQQQPLLAQNLPQYVSPVNTLAASPSTAFQYPEIGTQRQTPLNRQYIPQTQLQEQASAQNSLPYSSPLPPASPLPVLQSSEGGILQQQGPIYGQNSQQQGQALVQTPMPASSPVQYLPQIQLQQQQQPLLQGTPQYSNSGTRTQMPSVSGQQQPFGGYGVSNQIKNAQPMTLTSQYQQGQGQPYWNQEKASVGYGNIGNANFLTPQTRYNIALQISRLNAQKRARLLLLQQQQQAKQSQLNSGFPEGTTLNQQVLQQYQPTRTLGASAPENANRQQYFDPALNQQMRQNSNIPFRIQQNFNQQYSQAGRSPTLYASPPYIVAQDQSGQITTGAYQSQMKSVKSQNTYGTNGLIPELRSPTAFNQYPYSSDVISAGEAALYRSEMGRLPQQPYPTVTRARTGSSVGNSDDRWRKLTGNDKEVNAQKIQNDGKSIDQGNAEKSSHNEQGEVAKQGNSYGGDAPSAPVMQSQPQQSQAPEHNALAGRPTTSEKGSTGHHPRNHLPQPSGHTPVYSQSEVDAHHSRVTANNQTSQDSEFENEAKMLRWYVKKAQEELQLLENESASATQRPASVPPANVHGHPQTARPASAAGNYAEDPLTDQNASASAKKTSD